MATGDNLTLRIVGRYQSQNIVNTLHYNLSQQTSSDQDICENICTAWETANKSEWLAAHNTTYSLIGLKCFRLNGTAKTPGFVTINELGTRSGNPAPAFVCRTITLYTESTNSRRRGRLMLSGTITEDIQTDDGSLNETAKGIMDTLAASLLQGLPANGDGADLIIPPSGELPEEAITDYKSRETPSSVTSRRIKQFLIG